MASIGSWLAGLGRLIGRPLRWFGGSSRRAGVGIALAAILVLLLGLTLYWSQEPEPLSVDYSEDRPVGYATTDVLIRTVRTLLDKPGGYLHNDVMPPSVLMDNIPAFERGAVIQIRDLARVLRNDIGRAQSQSRENPDLAEAEPLFNYSYDRWLWPSTESRYRDGIDALVSYREGLDGDDAQFFARADNLRSYLEVVEKRLGGLTHQLSASVGQTAPGLNLAGDSGTPGAAPARDEIPDQTPWMKIDDVFYEARGSAWALLNFMRAIETDFESVLRDKNALVSLRHVVQALEASQQEMSSPVVLNGGGFGLFANHSLVMASYLSRANAAVIDLRELLAQG